MALIDEPDNRTVIAGQAYANLFEVSVSSSGPVTYRWQHSVDGGETYFNINPNGGVFTGSDTRTLGVNAGMTDLSSTWNGAMFRCVVESQGETIVSDPGVLTVIPQ